MDFLYDKDQVHYQYLSVLVVWTFRWLVATYGVGTQICIMAFPAPNFLGHQSTYTQRKERRDSTQLLKTTSLPSVNDKGHYTYNARAMWAERFIFVGLLQHS